MKSVSTLFPVISTVSEAHRRLTGRQMVQNLSRLARLALDRSCRISGLRLERLIKDDEGVPLPENGIYWSLSHKRDVVGGVAAPKRVGFDLETIHPVNDMLFSKVADGDEWNLMAGDRTLNFYRMWTAKEAVVKAVGKGIAGLSRCRIVSVVDDYRMNLTYDETPWLVVHHWFDNHVAALTSHHFEVSWKLMDPFALDREVVW